MKGLATSALSTLNYLFLREVFPKSEPVCSEIRDVICNEMVGWLVELETVEYLDSEIENLFLDELSEGNYLENLTLKEIETKLDDFLMEMGEFPHVKTLYLNFAQRLLDEKVAC